MKFLILFVLFLFSTNVFSQTCSGNCNITEVTLGCRLSTGGSCDTNFFGRCHRLFNSSGRIAWGPAQTDTQWLGFLSKAPDLTIGRVPISCSGGTCTNGSSGTPDGGASCPFPGGGSIPSGCSRNAYSASQANNCSSGGVPTCVHCDDIQQLRSCNNGVLSGSGSFGSCNNVCLGGVSCI